MQHHPKERREGKHHRPPLGWCHCRPSSCGWWCLPRPRPPPPLSGASFACAFPLPLEGVAPPPPPGWCCILPPPLGWWCSSASPTPFGWWCVPRLWVVVTSSLLLWGGAVSPASSFWVMQQVLLYGATFSSSFGVVVPFSHPSCLISVWVVVSHLLVLDGGFPPLSCGVMVLLSILSVAVPSLPEKKRKLKKKKIKRTSQGKRMIITDNYKDKKETRTEKQNCSNQQWKIKETSKKSKGKYTDKKRNTQRNDKKKTRKTNKRHKDGHQGKYKESKIKRSKQKEISQKEIRKWKALLSQKKIEINSCTKILMCARGPKGSP